jgi:hypothetical protein
MQFFGLERILPLVPAVAGVLLVIAAIYAKSLLGLIGRGFNQAKALKDLPANSRLPALEIIENVLKISSIETESLNASQRFKLIQETLKVRQDAAKRRFILLVVFAAFMFLASALWFAYAMYSDRRQDAVEAELSSGDVKRFSDVLARRGFFSLNDDRIITEMANITGRLPSDLRAQISQFEKIRSCDSMTREQCNRTLFELRDLARDRKPPFNEPGMFFHASLNGEAQPRRFFVNVTESFPFKGGAVDVINPQNHSKLTLLPRVGITTEDDPMLIHLNEQQLLHLFGRKDVIGNNTSGPRKEDIVVRPVTSDNPTLTDPKCSKYWEGPDHQDRLCKVGGTSMKYADLLESLS